MSCHSQQANTEVGVEAVVDRPGDGGGDIPGVHGHLEVDATVDEKAEAEEVVVVGVDDIAYLAVEVNTEGEGKHSAGDEGRPWASREREAAYLVVVVDVVVVDVVEEVPDTEAEGGWGDGNPFLAREVDVESSEGIC